MRRFQRGRETHRAGGQGRVGLYRERRLLPDGPAGQDIGLPGGVVPAAPYVAQQRQTQGRRVAAVERPAIRHRAAVITFPHRLHPARHAEVADAALAQAGVHIGEHGIEDRLRQGGVARQPAGEQRDKQADHVEVAVERVGDGELGVE